MPSPISELHSARREMLAGHAREALAKLAQHDVPFASLAIVRGECHYVLGEWSEAVRNFEEALRLSPNSPRAEIMLELSAEMMELSKTIRPAATVEELLGIPREGQQSSSLRKLSTSTQPPPAPLPSTSSGQALEKEWEISSDEIGLVSETLANVMMRQGKFDEARKVYIQLARLNPDRYEYFRDKIIALEARISE